MKRTSLLPQRPPAPVFCLSTVPAHSERLRASLTNRELRSFGRINDLAKALRGQRDALLLLWSDALPSPGEISAVIAEIERQVGMPPRWICLAPDNGIQLRLEALRAGCLRFFAGAIDAAVIATAIEDLPKVAEADGARVLVVDDSQVDAMRTAGILERAGFAAKYLTDELEIIETLADFKPELILLDLNMPRASGAELAAIIRDQAPHLLTPIVYLSGESDVETQRRALQRGGDEFLNKPVPAKTLIETVAHRLARRRSVEQRLQVDQGADPVTGLPNRYAFLQDLKQALADPAIHRPCNGLIFFALEQGDLIAKAIGVGGGDVLMGQAGALLRELLQTGDQAARFGIYSFMVLARRDDGDALTAFAEQLHRRFGERAIDLVTARARMSVAVGIAPLDEVPVDALTLVPRAESAYRAALKSTGRHLARYTRAGAATADDVRSVWARRLDEALQTQTLPVGYQALLALDDGDRVIERYYCEPDFEDLGVPQPSVGQGLAALVGDLCDRVDRCTLDRVMQAQAERRSSGSHCRIWVRQCMRSLRSKEWVLWLGSRRDALKLRKARITLVLGQDDLLANLTVAGAIFPILKGMRIAICIEDYSDDAMARSLLDDYPIRWVMPTQAMVDGNINRLCELVSFVHARRARVIAGGVNDPAGLSRAWSSGADLVRGAFVQPPQSSMNYDFGGAGGD